MRPMFYEVPEGPIPKREQPYLTGLSLYLVFYSDGVEVKVNENYEGRTDFDIEPGLLEVTRRFLANFAESTCVAAHQILKVDARSARGTRPRSRYDIVTQDEETQTVVEDDSPEPRHNKPPKKKKAAAKKRAASKKPAADAEIVENNVGEGQSEQGGDVRAPDTKLPGDPPQQGDTESGSIGI